METIHTAAAPEPGGHYSQAVVHSGLVFVSGQLAFDPATGKIVGNEVETQTEQTLRNVEAILHAAGTEMSCVLSMTIFISDISQWAAVNSVYARLLGSHRPARAVIPASELPAGCHIEIQAIAALPETKK